MLLILRFALLLILFVQLGVPRITDEDYGGLPSFELTVPIEHAIYTSAKSNSLIPNFIRFGTFRTTDKSGSVTIDQGLSIESNITQASTLPHSLYYLRVPIGEKSDNNADPDTFVFTSLPLEVVINSKYALHLVVSTGPQNTVTGITLAPSSPAPSGSGARLSFKVTVHPCATAPPPDVDRFLDRLEREQAETARREKEDNRGFFSKYWMYIVPFVLVMFFVSSQGGGAEGGGGGS
jgi:hypothetical protein